MNCSSNQLYEAWKNFVYMFNLRIHTISYFILHHILSVCMACYYSLCFSPRKMSSWVRVASSPFLNLHILDSFPYQIIGKSHDCITCLAFVKFVKFVQYLAYNSAFQTANFYMNDELFTVSFQK